MAAVREAAVILLHSNLGVDRLDEVCERLRRQTHRPLVVMGDQADERLTVAVLAAGADDCLGPQTSLAEVIARLRAQLRRDREYSAADQGVRYDFGEFSLDTGSHDLVVRGQRVPLTPKEFDLCQALAAGAGRPVRREDLLREVWGYSEQIATRTLDVHIGRLRQKLEQEPAQPRIIVTVPGVGYKLVTEP